MIRPPRKSSGSLHERRESLLILTVSPTIWAVHFLASYLTAAVWCAKVAGRDGSLWEVRVAIAIYTLAALLGIGITGWLGLRRHSLGGLSAPHDLDTRKDRYRFLGFATLLLSGLSAAATIYVALAAVFLETCH